MRCYSVCPRKEKDELKLARYFTFTEYAASQEDEHLRNDLSFDAKLFRANKEVGKLFGKLFIPKTSFISIVLTSISF